LLVQQRHEDDAGLEVEGDQLADLARALDVARNSARLAGEPS
jgi:hypothetical protein